VVAKPAKGEVENNIGPSSAFKRYAKFSLDIGLTLCSISVSRFRLELLYPSSKFQRQAYHLAANYVSCRRLLAMSGSIPVVGC
jgi:hypothetical protein